jgi:predicted membrane chloride channel (bestrophin family)
MFRSSDLKRIMFPDVLTVSISAGLLTYYNHLCAMEVWKILDTDGDGVVGVQELKAGIESGIVEAHHIMGTDFFITGDMLMLNTMVPFSLTSIALGMMLSFRAQNCSSRYSEARIHWGAMINETRALSARILALSPPLSENSEVTRAATQAVKCIMTFPHMLKYHVTVDGHSPDLDITLEMSDNEVDTVKCKALRKELEAIWDYNDVIESAYVDRFLEPGVVNRPLHVLQELNVLNARVFEKSKADGGAGLHAVHIDEIYRSLTRFQDVLGACERIYKTPIYTGYSRFTSRCVFLWTNLLPLGLYPILGPAGTIPTCIVVAMFMYGLDDVGGRIEEPFGCLPLWQYCDGVDGTCRQLLKRDGMLKLLKN